MRVRKKFYAGHFCPNDEASERDSEDGIQTNKTWVMLVRTLTRDVRCSTFCKCKFYETHKVLQNLISIALVTWLILIISALRI